MTTYINQDIQNRLYGYITLKLKAYEYRRGWFKLDCPFCLGKGKMGIHLKNNVVHCFKCGYVKPVIPFLLELEQINTYKELKVILNDFNNSSYSFPKQPLFVKKPVKLPEHFKLIIFGKTRYGIMARNYLKNRGLNILDLARKGVGYCTEGRYKGYIIFPDYGPDGNLRYFQTRKFFGNGPKFNNPKLEDFGVGKSTLIYNEQALNIYNEVNIVESVINGLTLGDNTVSLYGKAASKLQIYRLLSSPVIQFNIILDPDAIKEAILLGLTLITKKFIKLIVLPENKDVNDIGKKATMELIEKTDLISYNQLLKLKHGKNYTF